MQLCEEFAQKSAHQPLNEDEALTYNQLLVTVKKTMRLAELQLDEEIKRAEAGVLQDDDDTPPQLVEG